VLHFFFVFEKMSNFAEKRGMMAVYLYNNNHYMKMKLTLLLFSLLTAIQVQAEEINALVLHMASGKQVTCLLDEQPVVTFKGDELVLTTHMNVVSYKAADLQKFTYS